jgi:hypothetical protein
MTTLVRGLSLVALVICPTAVSASGLGLRGTQASHSYYCYYQAAPAYSYAMSYAQPAPATYAAPAYATPECTTEQAPAPRKLAQPKPAGPSAGPKTTEPPRAAGVAEQRSYFSAYAVAPRTTDQPAGERARVGFWNLSSQDLRLNIAGQPYTLKRGQSVKLDLARQFAWRVDGRDTQNETVPASEGALEIVIRR